MDVDRIAESFCNKNVLMTGGTGFMGKVFVEKILRVTKVKKLFLLIRSKANKSSKDRLIDLFSDAIFDKLKDVVKEKGENFDDFIEKKIQTIDGDCSSIDLGISYMDRHLITENVTMIYHFAATVRFSEPFKRAIMLNVRGVREILKLADECKSLEIFIHVSTAYCNLIEKHLLEKIYDSPANPHEIIATAERHSDEEVDEIFSKYFNENFLNTYIFTKNLAETLVAESSKALMLPTILCRPAIVGSTYDDPFPGWTAGVDPMSLISVAYSMGVLRTVFCNPDSSLNIVFVDDSIGNIMALTWDYLQKKDSQLKVVNLDYIPVRIDNILINGPKYVVEKYPLDITIWYPNVSITYNRQLNQFRSIFYHWIPAIIVDILLRMFGRKPMLWKAQKKITKELKVIEKFLCNIWTFDTSTIDSIKTKLSKFEMDRYMRKEFNSENEMKFYDNFARGVRKYMMKQDDKDLPKAKNHMQRLYYIKIITQAMFYGYLLYLLKGFYDRF